MFLPIHFIPPKVPIHSYLTPTAINAKTRAYLIFVKGERVQVRQIWQDQRVRQLVVVQHQFPKVRKTFQTLKSRKFVVAQV